MLFCVHMSLSKDCTKILRAGQDVWEILMIFWKGAPAVNYVY